MEYFRKKYPIQTNEIFITQDGKFDTLKLNLKFEEWNTFARNIRYRQMNYLSRRKFKRP